MANDSPEERLVLEGRSSCKYSLLCAASQAALRSLLVVSAIGLPACQTIESEDIRGTDNSVLFPALRGTVAVLGRPGGSISFAEPASDGDPSAAPSEKKVEGRRRVIEPSLAVDGEISYGHGRTFQNLSSGQFIGFDDLRVEGPASVKAEHDLTVGYVAARGGIWLIRMFGFEGMAGIAVEHVETELKAGSVRKEDGSHVIGPLLGLQLSVRPVAGVTAYGRGSVTPGWGESGDSGRFALAELGLEVAPAPSWSIFGGWRINTFEFKRDRDTQADIDLEHAGVIVGLRLRY